MADGERRRAPLAMVEPPDAGARPAEAEVWPLLGRADVILRGVLGARDRAERRLWEERARVWLGDVSRAWVQGQPRPR